MKTIFSKIKALTTPTTNVERTPDGWVYVETKWLFYSSYSLIKAGSPHLKNYSSVE